VFVLTSRTLPRPIPAGVEAWSDGAEALLDHLQHLDLPGHVKLMGGAKTIQAFRAVRPVDRMDVYLMPVILGKGVPFSLPGAPPQELKLESHTVYQNGAVKLVYTPSEGRFAQSEPG
jgi:dihydrofolate reductase